MTGTIDERETAGSARLLHLVFVCVKFPSRQSPSSGFSGAARRARRIAAHLRGQGHRVEYVSDTDCPALEAGELVHRVPADTWRNRPRSVQIVAGAWWMMLAFGRLFRVFTGDRPDAVLCFSVSHLSLVSFLVAKLLGIPVFLSTTMLGGDDLQTVRRSRLGHLKLRLLKSGNGVINVSRGLWESCRAAGLPEHSNHLIPNPVDLARFQPARPGERRELRKTLGLSEHDLVFVSVGEVNQRKSTEDLVDAFLGHARHIEHSVLVLVGPYATSNQTRDYFSTIQRRIDKAEATQRVRFLGELPSSHEWLRAADGFVFASRMEGFPSAVIEALACGLPVMVREIRGVMDYILDGMAFAKTYTVNEELEAWMSDLANDASDPVTIHRQRCSRLSQFSPHLISSQYIEVLSGSHRGRPCSDQSQAKASIN